MKWNSLSKYFQNGVIGLGSIVTIVALIAMGLTVQEQQDKINGLERQFFEFLSTSNSSDNPDLSAICSAVMNFVSWEWFSWLHKLKICKY